MNRILLCILSLSAIPGFALEAVCADERKPNVIVILADDLGYGDLSCFGAKDIAPPNIDRMAAEGAKFSSFYVSAVCSPTRASLMTGSHSTRVGIGGVMFPRNNHGLNPEEITLPELLKGQGYATATIGKWHRSVRQASWDESGCPGAGLQSFARIRRAAFRTPGQRF